MNYTFVNSVKGGCGKTTVALMWALKKSEFKMPKACIVDLDILGTAFEYIIEGERFVNEKAKENSSVEIPAEIFLNDLCNNVDDFKKTYKSRLSFDKNCVDIVLCSPEFGDKSSFMPANTNQYESLVSYDYFKTVTKRLLKELNEYRIQVDIFDPDKYIADLKSILQEYERMQSDEQLKSPVVLANPKVSERLEELGEKREMTFPDSKNTIVDAMEKVRDKINEAEISADRIAVIQKHLKETELYHSCVILDKEFSRKDKNTKALKDIVNDAEVKIKYNKTHLSAYSDIVFDMPPNSEPYSDIFFEFALSKDFKDTKDNVTIVLVSSMNRAHIKANLNWINDFIYRATSQKWNLPDKVVFVFNDVGNIWDSNAGGTEEYDKEVEVWLKEQILKINDQFSTITTAHSNLKPRFYILNYMSDYARIMLSDDDSLTSIQLDKLVEYDI